MEFDDIYIKPTFECQPIDWSQWEIGFDVNKTVQENTAKFSDAVVDEIWGTITLSLDTSYGAEPSIAVANSLDDMWGFVPLSKIFEGGVYNMVDMLQAEGDPTKAKEELTKLRNVLTDAISSIDKYL